MQSVLHDLRYELRQLAKKPGFTAIAVLTLALGAGATALMYTVIDSVLLRPLPYPEAGRLVDVQAAFPHGGGSVSLPNFEDWRKESRSFSAMAAYVERSVSVQLPHGEPVHTAVVSASASLFDVLQVQPMLGRTFLAAEDRPEKPCVAVLSAEFWHEHFDSDTAIAGQNIELDGQACIVIGVMPSGFAFPARDDEVWTPFRPTPQMIHRGTDFLHVIGRLKPSVTLATAQGELSVVARRLQAAYPEDKDETISARSYQESVTGNVRPALVALLGAVGLLLLITCANVANLQLARALGRKREIAIRLALGATRLRIARQLLTENLILAVGGVGAGLSLASGSLGLLKQLAGDVIPRVREIDLHLEVCVAMLGVAGIAALLFGLAPMLQSARLRPHYAKTQPRLVERKTSRFFVTCWWLDN